MLNPSGEIEDSFPFEQSSPLSLRQQSFSSPPAPPSTNLYPLRSHDYNFSGAICNESTSGPESEGDILVEDAQEAELSDIDRRISGVSSISSFPASVSQYQLPRDEQYGGRRTPTKRDSVGTHSAHRSGGTDFPSPSPRSVREFHSAFRHPSSVRALQMRDEIMSDTHSVLRHHRRSGSQMSYSSQRSAYSGQTSPTKRSSRSHHGSPRKTASNLTKEFPLVLLHCTLLPPTILPQSANYDDYLVSELLPQDYKKRWIALRDKVVGDIEVRTRGLLISHPREDYELLEERLLESLDLEKPRIRHSHYFHSEISGADSGFESGSLTEDEADLEMAADVKCPDCGRRLRADEVNRKWEIKVFAANGLMRAGAWSAAWQEMEKIDVEVKVWLPEEVQRDLEAKLAVLEASRDKMAQTDTHNDLQDPDIPSPREREIYGESGRFRSQAEIDGFEDEPGPPPQASTTATRPVPLERITQAQLVDPARHFRRDSRNFLVGVLSVLILCFALASREVPTEASAAQPTCGTMQVTEVLTTTITATSIAISTATVTASISAPTPATSSALDESGLPSQTSGKSLPQESLGIASTLPWLAVNESLQGTSTLNPTASEVQLLDS